MSDFPGLRHAIEAVILRDGRLSSARGLAGDIARVVVEFATGPEALRRVNSIPGRLVISEAIRAALGEEPDHG